MFLCPHSLDSIVIDHRSFMEARGDLKRANQVYCSQVGLCIHVHIPLASESPYMHLTKKLKVTSKILFQSVGPLNKINILFSSLQLHQASGADLGGGSRGSGPPPFLYEE